MKNLMTFAATLMILGIFAPRGIARKVVFKDDFNEGMDKWTVVVSDQVPAPPGAPWQVHWRGADGWLDSGNGDHDPEALIASAGDANWRDISFEVDTARNQGTGYIFIGVRFQDKENYYSLRWMRGDPGGVLAKEGLTGIKKDNPELWILKKVDGDFTLLAQVGFVDGQAIPDFDVGKFFRLKLEVNGNNLKGFINSKLLIEATDRDNKLKKGAIAVGQGEFHAFFDNVEVRDLNLQAVSPKNKLAMVWADLKNSP